MIISIVAFDLNQLIGAAGDLVWRIKKDMDHFKSKTMGNICVMARKTWESIPEKYRPLDGRLNIVVTRDPNYQVPAGVLLAHSWEEAKALAEQAAEEGEYAGKDIYVCGGAELYKAAMDDVDVLEVTEIAKVYPTDNLSDLRYFPEIDPAQWTAVNSFPDETDTGLKFDFITYARY